VNSDSDGSIPFMIAVAIPILYTIIKFILSQRNNHNWETGVFNQRLPLNRDNILEAYICLAGRMLQADRVDARKKITYIHKYFTRRFPHSNYNFKELLAEAYKFEIKTISVANWINRNVKKREYKIQIIYFLVGLSMVDGSFNTKELRLLKTIAKQLHLTDREFDSVVNMYHSYKRESKKHQQAPAHNSIREICCKILGVSQSATADEIKKAYRKMAKLHHPDKFYNESKEQQEIAQEKFLKIQKAYEALT